MTGKGEMAPMETQYGLLQQLAVHLLPTAGKGGEQGGYKVYAGFLSFPFQWSMLTQSESGPIIYSLGELSFFPCSAAHCLT